MDSTQVLRPTERTPVRELVEKRTAVSETWVNADGSYTLTAYREPKYFQTAGSGSWVPIDSSLVLDERNPGWFRNAANSWSVRFGPVVIDAKSASGGVVATGNGQTLQFAPHGSSMGRIDPVVDAKAGTVVYPSVWRNVDVRYTVTASGVREDLVLNGPTDGSDFLFDSAGVHLGLDRNERNRGGLVAEAAGGFTIAAPVVAGKNGEEVTASAHPSLVATDRVVTQPNAAGAASQSLTLSVDPNWLHGLRVDQFPVTVDPTVVFYGTSVVAYASNGYSCSYPCGVRIGNSQYLGDLYWRSVAYIPYESLIDNHQNVMSAKVNLVRTAGTSNGNQVYVCWAAAWSFGGACANGWYGTATLNDSVDVDVTGLYQYWVGNSIRGGSLGFAGNDVSGLFTFKDNWSALTVVYNTPPPKPTQAAPTSAAVLSTLTPQFTASTPGPDVDGDTVYFGFSIATGADGLSGSVLSSGLSTSSSWTVSDPSSLRDGQSYYWRAYTYDGINLTFSDAALPFRIDMRLGAGGPSPTDKFGPVQVNLATGNVSTSIATPSVVTVGGSMGLSLVYNSQAPQVKGLTGRYQWDGNNNKLFDEDVRLTRVDPQINFDWGTSGPSPSVGTDHFLARWTGYIAPGDGQWDFGAISDDGVRIYINGVLVLNNWVDQAAGAVNWGTVATNFGTPGTAKSITVEYYENTANAVLKLWARRHVTAPTPDNAQVVPASWLSPDASPLPAGWTMSPGNGGIGYVSARVSDSSVVLRANDGSSYEYAKTTGANGAVSFKPPATNDDVMVLNADGTLTVYGDDGNTYTFSVAGELTSVTSSTDDLHPAATSFTWTTPSGSPTRLTQMSDPVSSRAVTLVYGGGTCPTATGFTAAPTGMLCKVGFPDGSETGYLYNANGQLARIINPGGAITDLAYNAAGFLSQVRDPLANDVIAAGVRSSSDPVTTEIAYTGIRATSVTAPAPQPGGARPARTYTYSAGTTTIGTAGLTGTASVTYDANNRQTSAVDATGKVTYTTWDAADHRTSTIDAAQVKSTTIYDSHGWATDSYGPAASTSYNGLVGGAGVAHSTTAFDQGINALAAAYYANAALSGTPAKHATGLDATGTVNIDWGATPPNNLSTPWGVRLTGEITLASTGDFKFATWSKSATRVYIDDVLVMDNWTDPGSTRTRSPDGSYTNVSGGSTHRIRVDLSNTSGDASIELYYWPPGSNWQIIPASILKPRYGLATTSTNAAGTATTTSYTASNGIGPEHKRPTATTVDPTGLALTTTTTYESPSNMTFLRPTSKTLPAGSAATTTNTYYGNSDTRAPACSSGSTVNQAGRLKMTTDADGVQHEYIYDIMGRTIATRTGATSTAWICTIYDSRGRPSTIAYQAFGGDAGRTVTNNYSVNNNPLVTSASDHTGTITTTTDLDGRVISYTDALGTTTTTTYDQAGRPTNTSTTGADPLTRSYDDAGRLTTLRISTNNLLLAQSSYDTYGRLITVTYPTGTGNAGNGTSGTFGYGSSGHFNSITWNGPGGLITSETITARDAMGRITDQSIDGVDPYSGANDVYDMAGRLTTAHIPSHTYAYSYAATNTCGTLTTAGRDTNRTSMTIDAGAPVGYCYDNADRLTSTTDTAVGTIAYDDHGNTTFIFGETHTYDIADRHLSTTKGTTSVTYIRDATNRIIERKVNGTTTARYANTGIGDAPSLTLDANNNVIEQTLVLPGGTMLTTRTTGNTWSYQNIHGDYMATASQAGVKLGATTTYDPYGYAVAGVIPDNSAGSMDYGWLGKNERPLEQQSGFEPMIEMGARQYSPRLGRFIELDPVEGGSANAYDYVNADPVNGRDITGTCGECWAFQALGALFAWLPTIDRTNPATIGYVTRVPDSWRYAAAPTGITGGTPMLTPPPMAPDLSRPSSRSANGSAGLMSESQADLLSAVDGGLRGAVGGAITGAVIGAVGCAWTFLGDAVCVFGGGLIGFGIGAVAGVLGAPTDPGLSP